MSWNAGWMPSFVFGLLLGFSIPVVALLSLPALIPFLEHASWPLATVFIAWLLREQLAGLLERVESFEGRGYTVNLRKTIERMSAARLDSPEPAVSGGSSDEGMDKHRSHLKRLAAASPSAAIIESWLLIEDAAKTLASRNGDRYLDDKRSPHAVESWLRESGYLSPQAISVVTDLRVLRNLAAHARPSQRDRIGYEDAAQAIDVAVGIVDVLEDAGFDK